MKKVLKLMILVVAFVVLGASTPPHPTTGRITIISEEAWGHGNDGVYRCTNDGTLRVRINAGVRRRYTFDGWTSSCPDVVFEDPASTKTSIAMTEHDVTVVANWIPSNAPVYKVTLRNIGLGAIGFNHIESLYGIRTGFSDEFEEGEEVYVFPGGGAVFSGVFVDWITEPTEFRRSIITPSMTFSPSFFIMPAHDVTLTATWIKWIGNNSRYSTVINNYPAADDADIIGQSGEGEYISGHTVNLTAGTREGYKFVKWTAETYEVTGQWPRPQPDIKVPLEIINSTEPNASFMMPQVGSFEELVVTAHWEPIPPPTISFSPENIFIDDENLSQTVNVIGTASGEIIVNYDPDEVPDGVTVLFDATNATVTIIGVRPATNVFAAAGEFDVCVTREGVTETFAVSVNLSTTWTPPKEDDNQGDDNENDQNDNNQNDDKKDNEQNNDNKDDNNKNNQNGNHQGGGYESVGSSHSQQQITNITGTITKPTEQTQSAEQTDPTPQNEPTHNKTSDSIKLSLQIGSRAITNLANNTTQTMDVLPVLQNGRVLVPIRFVAEALGANVAWNAAANEVTITQNGAILTFAIGRAVRGMDVPAQIIDNRTFVPLRFIAEFFGADVNFCEQTHTIEIVRL